MHFRLLSIFTNEAIDSVNQVYDESLAVREATETMEMLKNHNLGLKYTAYWQAGFYEQVFMGWSGNIKYVNRSGRGCLRQEKCIPAS